MNAPTITIETPFSKIKIELYEWITGRKAEYIQGPVLDAVKLGAKANVVPGGAPEMSVNSIDAKSAINISEHREIESYVAKVGEEIDPKKCIELILDLPEDDYQFVLTEIKKIKDDVKKKSIQ